MQFLFFEASLKGHKTSDDIFSYSNRVGLKMGMFAAVGGGVMGFATGKMFAEHE